MTRMTALLALLLLPGIPEARAVTLTQIGTLEIAQTGYVTNGAAVFTLTNTTLPIWRVSPAPVEVRAETYWVSNVTDLYPARVGLELATIVEQVGARRIGHQKWLNQQPGFEFDSFIPGTADAALWSEYTAATNGTVSQMWTSRTVGGAAWNAASLIRAATNYPALAYSWQGEGAPGMPPITAISRWLGYSRGHGMGGTGTNSLNAGRKVYFLTAANVTVTNEVAEQITIDRVAGEDFTIVRFTGALPVSVPPLRVAGVEYAEKAPHVLGAPRAWFYTKANGTANNLAGPFNAGISPGDSGSPRMILLGDAFHLVTGTTTTGWSELMRDACAELLNRGGVDLAEMPDVETFSAYPTP
jgi:hypothetical protein